VCMQVATHGSAIRALTRTATRLGVTLPGNMRIQLASQRRRPRRRLVIAGLVAGLMTLVTGGSAAAAPAPAEVTRNFQYTRIFPDDVCGLRANTTMYTVKMESIRSTERPNGSFSFRYVAVVTYVSDYVDASLPTLTGRVTEVEHFMLTPGGTEIGTVLLHEFFGDISIQVHFHFTAVDGVVKVENFSNTVKGCP
jgi:hypothetical protein